jgi:hypothetical protein
MSLLPVGIGSAEEGGYQIERSLRFNSPDSAHLSRTPASAGNRKTYSFSCWAKRSALSSNQNIVAQGTNEVLFRFNPSDYINFADYTGGSAVWELTSASVYRDCSAWYHIVFAVDTTQATSTNRVKVWVNNVQVTFTGTYPSQNSDTPFNTTNAMLIGNRGGETQYFNGYLTEVNFIDGSALDPTSFGEFNSDTGVWQPKKYTGTYGTNGFYLNFSDNSGTTSTTLGKDSSGNGNNWTPNNFSVTAGAGNDSLVDSPTRYGTDTGAGGTVRGNYATWNPLALNITSLSDGNLLASHVNNNQAGVAATMSVTTGKWYWEIVPNSASSYLGVAPQTYSGSVNVNTFTGSVAYYGFNGDKAISGAETAYGSSYGNGDVIGVALDMDAGTVTFYKNNASQGAISLPLSIGYTPMCASGTGGATITATANFGQRPFAYTAPSGFKALVTTNLPAPTIEKGGDYFNTILYTGTGASNARTGVGFQPDFVWIKERNGAADHGLYDAVRGVQNQLESNTTTAETAEANGLTAFGTDGFTVGSLAQLNTSADTYVAWNWKANGAGVSNTDGTITSTVSVNTTSGFSIVTWSGNATSGATIGHGLGAVPRMIIAKVRNSGGTYDWYVYHASLGNTEVIYLNLTNARDTGSTIWGSTTPTSSVFSVGSNTGINGSGLNFVAYCFAPVAQYSAAFSYTGNGNADGPFVYTGFRPAFILIKQSSASGENWEMFDSVRGSYNSYTPLLYPNDSNAELYPSPARFDILSNGFKIRSSNAGVNASSATYIFMAFAENPFSIALAR